MKTMTDLEIGVTANLPSPEGAALGAQLARLTDLALADLRKKFPNHQEPCGTCAFRLGTVPNRCLPTVSDALKCVIECKDFMCHEKKGHFCCGWMIALRTVADHPPRQAPWEFSLTPEQEKLLGYK